MAAQLDRLVGADASLERASFGTELVTGTAVAGSWYKIGKVQGTTVFPAGYKSGDLIRGSATMTFSATNTAYLASFETVADCSSFDFSMSGDEIEVTVLADSVKKYRKGKVDMQGTIRGINMISEMRKAGSILNRFLRTSSTVGGVTTFNPVVGDVYYIRALLQDDQTTTGETFAFLFGQIELLGYSLGADVGAAQEWESGARFINNDPIVYFVDNA